MPRFRNPAGSRDGGRRRDASGRVHDGAPSKSGAREGEGGPRSGERPAAARGAYQPSMAKEYEMLAPIVNWSLDPICFTIGL